MTITMHSGIGTASFQPTLVDGWMLTSLQGSGDNKVAETLTAIAQLVASAEGGGKAASTGATKAGAAPPGGDGQGPTNGDILAPGLYGFDYNSVTGRMNGVCLVTLFGSAQTGRPVLPSCTADLNAATTWIAAHTDSAP